jgi:hypothetical protein
VKYGGKCARKVTKSQKPAAHCVIRAVQELKLAHNYSFIGTFKGEPVAQAVGIQAKGVDEQDLTKAKYVTFPQIK